MPNYNLIQLSPFIPSQDFDLSLKFYRDLGFEELLRIDNAVRLGLQSHSFWLQNYYVKEWAENAMLSLYVENLDDWFSRIQGMKLDVNYPGKARILAAPHERDGGYVMHVADPAGVLWHLRQSR